MDMRAGVGVALRRVCDMDRVDCLSSTHAALLPLIVIEPPDI